MQARYALAALYACMCLAVGVDLGVRKDTPAERRVALRNNPPRESLRWSHEFDARWIVFAACAAAAIDAACAAVVVAGPSSTVSRVIAYVRAMDTARPEYGFGHALDALVRAARATALLLLSDTVVPVALVVAVCALSAWLALEPRARLLTPALACASLAIVVYVRVRSSRAFTDAGIALVPVAAACAFALNVYDAAAPTARLGAYVPSRVVLGATLHAALVLAACASV